MASAGRALGQAVSRRLLVAAGLAGTGLAGTGLSIRAAAAEGTPATGDWTVTDDRGKTISLPARPERVVAFSPVAAALWELGVRPVGVFGPFRGEDGAADPQVGEVDLDAVTSIGDYGEFDLERLIALQPDLLVGLSLADVPNTLWYVPEEASATVEAIVPTFGLALTGRSQLGLIEAIESLAAALGADLDTPELVSDGTEFAAAEAALRGQLAERDGLSVLVISASADEVYVANPSWFADLQYFQEVGLPIMAPDTDERWELLSWEQIGQFQTDLILVDNRGGGVPFDLLDSIGTWQTLPAARAGQVGPWHAVAPYGRRAFTGIVRELTDIIQDTDDRVAE